MLSWFRPLRFRLTLLFVVVFAALQLVFWTGVDLVRTSDLKAHFDGELLSRAQSMAQAVEQSAADRGQRMDAELARKALTPFTGEGLYLELRRPNGDSLFRSENLKGFEFPSPAGMNEEGSPNWPLFDTAPAELSRALLGGPYPLRLITLRVPVNGDPHFLAAGMSQRDLQEMIGESRRMLIIFGLATLLVAGAAAWLVTGRWLAPIGEIARRARVLSASKLSQRVPEAGRDDEVGELTSVFNRMLERLERDFRAQSQFVADVSHELKTPLAVLLGEAQLLLRRKQDDPQVREFAENIVDETRRMLRTVESFLILSRARAGKRPAVSTEVLLEPVVLRAVSDSRHEAAEQKVRVVPRLGEEEDAEDDLIVLGDETLLASMVSNLIHGAVRHSAPGESVTVEMGRADHEVEIRVRDKGDRIAEEKLQRLFDRFYQPDLRGDMSGSSGVGLSIVKAVAELHGGRVAARNHPEGGCEFSVTLPLAGGMRRP